ncbi:MAG: TlpA disulfide reductase family protein [Myxococcaceae bacterium]
MRGLTIASVLTLALASCAHQAPAFTLDEALGVLPSQTAGPSWDRDAARGKVVLVMFITSWCFPCVADLVVMEKLQRDFGPQGFQAVLVGLDLEGAKTLDPFASSRDYPLPIVVGNDRLRNGDTVFGSQRALPTRFLFSRDGALVLAYGGVADPKDLIEAVRKEVEKK